MFTQTLNIIFTAVWLWHQLNKLHEVCARCAAPSCLTISGEINTVRSLPHIGDNESLSVKLQNIHLLRKIIRLKGRYNIGMSAKLFLFSMLRPKKVGFLGAATRIFFFLYNLWNRNQMRWSWCGQSTGPGSRGVETFRMDRGGQRWLIRLHHHHHHVYAVIGTRPNFPNILCSG